MLSHWYVAVSRHLNFISKDNTRMKHQHMPAWLDISATSKTETEKSPSFKQREKKKDQNQTGHVPVFCPLKFCIHLKKHKADICSKYLSISNNSMLFPFQFLSTHKGAPSFTWLHSFTCSYLDLNVARAQVWINGNKLSAHIVHIHTAIKMQRQ